MIRLRRGAVQNLAAASLALLSVWGYCIAQESGAASPPAPTTSAGIKPSQPVRLQIYWLKQLGNKAGTRPAVWHVGEVTDPKTKKVSEILVDIATIKPVSKKQLQDEIFSGIPLVTEHGIVEKSCQAMVVNDDLFCVQLILKPDAAKSMKTFTTTHPGEYLGIFINGELITAPIVEKPTAEKCMISGEFTIEEVKELAAKLNSAAEG